MIVGLENLISLLLQAAMLFAPFQPQPPETESQDLLFQRQGTYIGTCILLQLTGQTERRTYKVPTTPRQET